MWLEAGECWPGLLECHGILLLVPILFHQLVFPCSYLIGGTIPTSLLVLAETLLLPFEIKLLPSISLLIHLLLITSTNYSIIISGPHCTCDGKNVHLPPTPADPTPFADPTLSDDPSTLQLQPNPSYCLLEMSHQQPISSQVENEAEYVKYL